MSSFSTAPTGINYSSTTAPAPPVNRQESHRIYLQLFSPHSATNSRPGADPSSARAHHATTTSTTAAESSTTSTPPVTGGGGSAAAVARPIFHRHSSHDVHPPNYPMTTPGAPYQFSSSSESSSSSFASYSFSSSLSSAPNSLHGGTSRATSTAGGPMISNQNYSNATNHLLRNNAHHHNNNNTNNLNHNHSNHHPNHTIRNNSVRPAAPSNHSHGSVSTPRASSSSSNNKPRFVGYPSTMTTSAAVRLTDRAKSKDVTALLRGKFGLPPISISSPKNNDNSTHHYHHGSIAKRNNVNSNHIHFNTSLLSQWHGSGSSSSSSKKENQKLQNTATSAPSGSTHHDNSRGEEIDALVLVGTIERPPKGYLRFEHEEFLEEKVRLDAFRNFQNHRSQQQQQHQYNNEQLQQQQQQQSNHPYTQLQPQFGQHMRDTSLADTITTSNQQQQYQQPQHFTNLPISESAATIRASGAAKQEWMSSMLLTPSSDRGSSGGFSSGFSCGGGGGSDSNIGGGGIESSSTAAAMTATAPSTIGLDLSSSRGTSVFGGGNRTGTSWGTLVGMGITDADGKDGTISESVLDGSKHVSSSSRGKLTTLVSELSVSDDPTSTKNDVDSSAYTPLPTQPNQQLSHPNVTPKFTNKTHGTPSNHSFTATRSGRTVPLEYEYDSEPIHIVRTVLPDEHPLQVRDEMTLLLVQSRINAEHEMGLRLHLDHDGDYQHQQRKKPQQLTQPTFRWYFQPCCPLGGSGSSLKTPKIQSIPSYIDLDGYCTGAEEESEADDGDDSDCDDGEHSSKHENVTRSPLLEDANKKNYGSSVQMQQLIKERRRISLLRDLSDPSFLLSGYLLKQSWRDPNVWRRVYCVLSEDRMWIIGRMRPLRRNNDFTLDKHSNAMMYHQHWSDEILSTVRVGRHSYIKLHRSLLLEGGGGDGSLTEASSSLRRNGTFFSPLGRRLPNAFRICTAQGTCHTFRAFNAPSFRVWTKSLTEKIALKHGDGLMDLGNLIAEEETLARCRRMEDVAVTPLLEKISSDSRFLSSLKPIEIMMNITRFSMSVAEYRELRRHTEDAVRPNHGMVVNVRTKVGPAYGINHPSGTRQASGGHGGYNSLLSVNQLAKHDERVGMSLAVWEDARVVASKSAQLLHALAALQHSMMKENSPQEANGTEVDCETHKPDNEPSGEKGNKLSRSDLMDGLLKEQKDIQIMLGKRWDGARSSSRQESRPNGQMDDSNCNGSQAGIDELALPPLELFDPLLDKFQRISTVILA